MRIRKWEHFRISAYRFPTRQVKGQGGVKGSDAEALAESADYDLDHEALEIAEERGYDPRIGGPRS